jgi:hypothetical protein
MENGTAIKFPDPFQFGQYVREAGGNQYFFCMVNCTVTIRHPEEAIGIFFSGRDGYIFYRHAILPGFFPGNLQEISRENIIPGQVVVHTPGVPVSLAACIKQ